MFTYPLDSTPNRHSWEKLSADKLKNLIPIDCDYFPECDNSIQWTGITQALEDKPKNKAPGADGVSSEVWKLVMAEPTPTSSIAKSIQKNINIMHDSGDIPKCLETLVVVPVPKKGDLKDRYNYRGISLILTMAKLMAKIDATKLSKIDTKCQILNELNSMTACNFSHPAYLKQCLSESFGW
ncbi:Transposon TX1 uncharacterized [Smittium culicis]|uniref:Transposon TX1 uncharacterized n=1 Tax=Smittium culicis TaxID=133412 RepID=A0A1R1XXB1_9FUNG|nr:Transposon TX1 uncharacterized [Smittium culicis]